MVSMCSCLHAVLSIFAIYCPVRLSAVVIKTLKVPYGNTLQEEHTCRALPLEQDKEEYIVAFDPKADSSRVLHLSVQVCDDIPSQQLLWSCGDAAPGCTGYIRPVYVWGMNSTAWRLPPETAIPVGGTSGGRYIVLQAHLHKTKHTEHPTSTQPDYAAVKMHISRHRPQFEIGLLILGNTGYIPALDNRFISESACPWISDQPAYILGYRLHTHGLGRWVEGFVLADGRWRLIGKGSPLSPENVQRSSSDVYLENGDIVASRCYFNNHRSEPVSFGSAYNDEMCNFHVIYVFPYGASSSLRFRTCAEDAQQFHLKDVDKGAPPLKENIYNKDQHHSY